MPLDSNIPLQAQSFDLVDTLSKWKALQQADEAMRLSAVQRRIAQQTMQDEADTRALFSRLQGGVGPKTDPNFVGPTVPVAPDYTSLLGLKTGRDIYKQIQDSRKQTVDEGALALSQRKYADELGRIQSVADTLKNGGELPPEYLATKEGQEANKALLDQSKSLREKEAAEMQKKMDQQKWEADELKFYSNAIARTTDPEQFKAIMKRLAGSDVGKKMFMNQDPNKIDAEVDKAVADKTFDKVRQQFLMTAESVIPKIMEVDTGGTKQLVSASPLGVTPVASYAVTKSPNSPQNNITVSVAAGQKKAEEKIGEGGGENVAGLHEKAKGAVDLVKDIDKAIELLNKGEAYTGLAANLQLAVAKVGELLGISNKKVSGTEILKSAQKEIALYAAKNLGYKFDKGFTDEERRNIERIVGGDNTLSVGAMVPILQKIREKAVGSINTWNQMRTVSPTAQKYYDPVDIPTNKSPLFKDVKGKGTPNDPYIIDFQKIRKAKGK